MGAVGWWPEELPAAQHARSITEILNAPSSRADRDQLRLEREAEADRRARAADAAAAADNMRFAAMAAGRPAVDPLAAARSDIPFRDQQTAIRRRSAIEVLRSHGLEDVITGGDSGCIFDPNLGLLEPQRDTAERDRMNFEYESGRSERESSANTAYVNRSRARLDERLRAAGMQSPGMSQRSRPVPAERCEPGFDYEPPVSYR